MTCAWLRFSRRRSWRTATRRRSGIPGKDGLAYLARERPDAVVLDVRLPTMGGVAVLRQIRSTDPGLPVIIMTGLATRGEIAEARRLGVTEIIEKPEVLKRFSEALTRVANLRRP